MSVSIDVKKIEKLTQLEATLELLQNPETYTKLLTEVKAVLKQYNDGSVRYATIEAAERFLQDAKAVLVKAKDEAKQIQVDADQKKKEIEEQKQSFALIVSKAEIDLAGKVSLLSEKTKEVEKREQAISDKVKQAEAAFTIDRVALDKRNLELAKREQVLQEKEDGLKKLFGK